jgi:hypothetical protein
MLRPESIRKHEINGITVEHRSQPPGPHSQFALDLNYVVMHLLNSATLETACQFIQAGTDGIPRATYNI